MTRTSLHDVTCSIARTVDILGDAWAWLIVRDAYLGVRRFEDFRDDLGISSKILSQRLTDLTEAGILMTAAYSDRPPRLAYHLTEKGNSLVPLLAALVAWGDRWEPTTAGPPIYFHHANCGRTGVAITCAQCGVPVAADTLKVEPGPGGSNERGTALISNVLARRPE